MADVIEKGDIYFFYRPKVNDEEIDNLDDVQRFYLVLVPDGGKVGRLFLVGKKRLPEIVKGKPKSTTREWMMNSLTDSPKKIGEEFKPIVYTTKTRGEQEQGEAIPAGEGRYALFERKSSTRLGYKLSRPTKPGKAQKELGILPEASFVISVRNPDVDVPGFPTSEPEYPKRLQEKFADERWIDVDDPELLNHESAQLLLIGAHDTLEQADVEITGKPDLFKTLGLERKEWPTEALEKGELTEPEFGAEAKAPEGDRSKGGERGGAKATQTGSAAGVAKSLKGVDFPKDSDELLDYAKDHDAPDQVIEVLEELPNRTFRNMADVQKAVGEVR